MKIRSTDYYTKNLEIYKKDFYRDNLTFNKKFIKWKRRLGRYVIHNRIAIHLRCKTNWPGDIVSELNGHGYELVSYTDQDIFIVKEFTDKILAEWVNAKKFMNEVITYNKYVVHNQMRGVRKKFIKWVYWYEIHSNEINFTLEDVFNTPKSRDKRLGEF